MKEDITEADCVRDGNRSTLRLSLVVALLLGALSFAGEGAAETTEVSFYGENSPEGTFEKGTEGDSTEVEEAKPPNIIFILADDLGYGDVGVYGQRIIQTPHLDRMAREGTQFTQFYAGSTVCAPSRWSLMTGNHMGHAYVRGNDFQPLRPQDRPVPEVLKEAGYATGMFGKWGLGREGTTGVPHEQGFDEFFGYLTHVHAHEHYTDYLWRSDGEQLQKVSLDTTQYTHDLFVKESLDFIERHRDEPFFLYVPFAVPHAALTVPDSSLQKYLAPNGRSLLKPEAPFPCCGVANTYRGQEQPHAAFAAMVTHMDNSVGRLLDKLEALGLDENTVVMFSSDNGPHIEGGAAPGFFESNGPLRGLKRDLFEGGIRVPMIAWGGPVAPGRVSGHIWAMWDFLPTAAELAGTQAPPGIDGLSMVSALTGQGQPPRHDYLYWEFHNTWGRVYAQALRQGRWKAIRFRTRERGSWLELYDLSEDVAETKDVSDVYPEVADRLSTLIDQARTEPEIDSFRIPY